ncbi:MAG: hypothetical protein MUC87_02240 [Bacteroidia bacterium]|jgi:hypothetical protein|nr:hypothetical protein [Bacteroidia bacterium]
MSGLTALSTLVKALKPNEITLCKNYLSAFDERRENYESKSRKLFDLLCSEEQHTEKALQFLLYGSMNVSAFSRLVLRLKEKLLEAVVLRANTLRVQSFTAEEKALVTCRNKITYAEFLLERGLIHLAEFHLSAAYETALQLEFYPELLRIITYLQKINPAKAAKYERQEIQVLNCLQLLHTCRELYRLAEVAAEGVTATQIQELRKAESPFHSARAKFILLETEALSAEKNNQFATVVRCRKYQLRLIKLHTALQSGAPERETRYKLALFYLQCRKTEQALIHIQQAKAVQGWDVAEKQELNHLEAAACILLKRFETAAQLLSEIPVHFDKTFYLKALLYYSLAQYAEAVEEAEMVSLKTADKEGFGAAVRQLLFMCMAALHNTPHAAKGGTLRRFMETLPRYSELTTREQYIFELITAVVEAEFNFRNVYQDKSETLNQLRESKPGLKPNLHGANTRQLFRWEIIPFHDWFISKALGVPFEMHTGRRKTV